jgi:hypothetical protein
MAESRHILSLRSDSHRSNLRPLGKVGHEVADYENYARKNEGLYQPNLNTNR